MDTTGNVYVTGDVFATFPTTNGAPQTQLSGYQDAFVTELAPTGSFLIFSTYLGGGNGEQGGSQGAFTSGTGIGVDQQGNFWVGGYTNTTDFPTTSNAYQTSYQGGGNDSFLTEYKPGISTGGGGGGGGGGGNNEGGGQPSGPSGGPQYGVWTTTNPVEDMLSTAQLMGLVWFGERFSNLAMVRQYFQLVMAELAVVQALHPADAARIQDDVSTIVSDKLQAQDDAAQGQDTSKLQAEIAAKSADLAADPFYQTPEGKKFATDLATASYLFGYLTFFPPTQQTVNQVLQAK